MTDFVFNRLDDVDDTIRICVIDVVTVGVVVLVVAVAVIDVVEGDDGRSANATRFVVSAFSRGGAASRLLRCFGDLRSVPSSDSVAVVAAVAAEDVVDDAVEMSVVVPLEPSAASLFVVVAVDFC